MQIHPHGLGGLFSAVAIFALATLNLVKPEWLARLRVGGVPPDELRPFSIIIYAVAIIAMFAWLTGNA